MRNFFDETTVCCENPVVIFNRSALYCIMETGVYFLNGHRREILDALQFYNFHEDCHFFNPFRLGFYKKINGKSIIDYDAINSSYVWSNYVKQYIPLFLVVGCCHCDLCKYRRCQEWCSRLTMEYLNTYIQPYLVTLTYDDEHLPSCGLDKIELQNFIKRLRHTLHDVRYFAVGEYGSKFHRPHYHVILFGVDLPFTTQGASILHEKVSSCWCVDRRSDDNRTYKKYGKNSYRLYHDQKGHVDVRPITTKGAFSYVSKYLLKSNFVPDGKNKTFPPLFSRRPGLGKTFFKRNIDEIRELLCSGNTFKYNYNGIHDLSFPISYFHELFPNFSDVVSIDIRRLVFSKKENINFIYWFAHKHKDDIIFNTPPSVNELYHEMIQSLNVQYDKLSNINWSNYDELLQKFSSLKSRYLETLLKRKVPDTGKKFRLQSYINKTKSLLYAKDIF